jgi:indole-3-glycerol phosphate synthase
MTMADALAQICAEKRAEVARRKASRPIADLDAAARAASAPRGFARCLSDAVVAGGYGLIGEIKRASPSKGLIRADFDPPALARAYARGGAACLSVLTDAPFFQGKDEHLVSARAAVPLPVLRKDFTLDPYQVVEARALGADCILLIMAALNDGTARVLANLAREWGMDALVEIHDDGELDRALDLPCKLIGINNRNLKTLAVDIATTEQLAPRVPKEWTVVCESGLETPDDLARMAKAGARCFLVGGSLMAQDDVEAATRALLARPTSGLHRASA